MEQSTRTTLSLDWIKKGLSFQCTGCGKCCTGSPGYVFLRPQDIEALAQHLLLSPTAFLKTYTRYVHGAYALLDRKGSDHCIFLKDNACTAYEARPLQCRTFPWWIENLSSPEAWNEAALHCEGITQEAPLTPKSEILATLLKENF